MEAEAVTRTMMIMIEILCHGVAIKMSAWCTFVSLPPDASPIFFYSASRILGELLLHFRLQVFS